MSATPTDRGLRIGLTGGIGSGKSTVADMLVACGAALVDTDAIARTLTAPEGAAIEAIRLRFGPDFIDASGALDRVRMRTHAFSNPAAKAALEAILHPLIFLECERQAAAALPRQSVVFDVPLLVEAGRRWREKVDQVLVVDCSEAVQIERILQRPGWTMANALAVISQQASRDTRRAAADALVLNEGLTLSELNEEIKALWRHWHPVEQSN